MGGSTYTVESEEVEGHFASRKKRAVKPLFGGVVLTFGDLVASELVRFEAYGSINACQARPIKSAINACQDISLIQYKEQSAGDHMHTHTHSHAHKPIKNKLK